MTLREFLQRDPLGDLEREVRDRRTRQAFSEFLEAPHDRSWSSGLSLFVENAPYHFWDFSTVSEALDLLEQNRSLANDCIASLQGKLAVAFDNLFRPSAAFSSEADSFGDDSPGFVVTSTVFQPEYLRLVEFVFAPFAFLMRAAARGKPIPSGLKLVDACSNLVKDGHACLVAGYDSGIRNALAHGQVHYGGLEIHFTPDRKPPFSLRPSEFVEYFDSLWRTSTSLAVAFVLYVCRALGAKHSEGLRKSLPDSLVGRVAVRRYESRSLKLISILQSNAPLAGRQLHVSLQTTSPDKTEVLKSAARVAMGLVDFGCTGYDRFAILVHCGFPSPSLVALRPADIETVVDERATPENVPRLFEKNPLLWHVETRIRRSVRTGLGVVRGILDAVDTHLADSTTETLRWSRSYYIRNVETVDSGGLRTVKVHVVLRHNGNTLSPDFLTDVACRVARRYSWQASSKVLRHMLMTGAPRWRPDRVGIRVYREDGPLRWLGSQGWASGNLAAVAEWIRSPGVTPGFVMDPECVQEGIRLRFSSPAPCCSSHLPLPDVNE